MSLNNKHIMVKRLRTRTYKYKYEYTTHVYVHLCSSPMNANFVVHYVLQLLSYDSRQNIICFENNLKAFFSTCSRHFVLAAPVLRITVSNPSRKLK